MKLLLNILCMSCYCFSYNSQTNYPFCGQYLNDSLARLEGVIDVYNDSVSNAYLESFTQNFENSIEETTGSRVNGLTLGQDYIIPTVVHIVHSNGIENISDETVERAIELINVFFAGSSPFDKHIDPDFLPIRGAFFPKKLKFVLANFDPNGNPTNGINRYYNASFTENGRDTAMRLAYHWPRENYLNIYIVRVAAANNSASAFATFPSTVDAPADAYLDGVVMTSYTFGEHNDMYSNWYFNLCHEIGHWLNLTHIWAPSGANGDPQYCNSDDFVGDTPNTKGNSLIHYKDRPDTAVFSCGTKDNYTNMMDYTTPISAMFTTGQRNRMEAALNSPVADRNNLWTRQNVLNTLYGCSIGLDSDGDFIPDACDPCPNDASNDLDNDGVCGNEDLCAGFPDVDNDFNVGVPDACDSLAPIINFDESSVLSYDLMQDSGLHTIYDNGATLYLTHNAWKGVPLNYTITPNTILEFDFMSTIEGELHYIGIDDDLDFSPLLAFKLFGFQTFSQSTWANTDFFTYKQTDKYIYKHFTIPIGQYYTGFANYLVFAADNDLFNDTWIAGIFYPGGGSFNNGTSFFRNVKLHEFMPTSISSKQNERLLVSIYPNPTTNKVTLELSDVGEELTLDMYNLGGKLIEEQSITTSKSVLDLSDYDSGIYLLKLSSTKGVFNTKIIKQ